MEKFFFITSYDALSSVLLSDIINIHPEMHCEVSTYDPFISADSNKTRDISIDEFIVLHTKSDKRFCGNAQYYSAFELQHKSLIQRTHQPHRKVNLLLSPELRVNFILNNWLAAYTSAESALTHIEEHLKSLESNKHDLFEIYNFGYFYKHINKIISAEKLANMHSAENKLFILALAKVIAYDSADIPSPGKNFCFENLIKDTDDYLKFIEYLTYSKIEFDSHFKAQLESKLQETRTAIEKLNFAPWSPWQSELLDKLIHERLYTIYYPHIDKPLASFYKAEDYELSLNKEGTHQPYSKLISIQLNSNRPAQLAAYFDNIEETADHPQDIEVLVNIDTGSLPMRSLLESEIPKRKFTIKYVETPRPKSFCDLWEPINTLFEITDPKCYFLLNVSDEMLFAESGWDTTLKKYVGYFPDHLFRLRASRNKFRNYFDRWECSFAQDSIPITTYKWVETGGNWNPCFGPDSFQQLIAFYLAKEGMFSNEQFLRELPVIDIKFLGDVPAMGIDPDKAWKHCSDHIKAMQICQSYKMQLEARRRAVLIKANIIAYSKQLQNYGIVDIKSKKRIRIADKANNVTLFTYSYKVNWLSISFTNVWRRLYFNYYFGDGADKKLLPIKSFLRYLKMKYKMFYKSYRALVHVKRFLVKQRRTLKKLILLRS